MEKIRIKEIKGYMKVVEGEIMGGWGSLGEVATKGARRRVPDEMLWNIENIRQLLY